jgi:hypothetical protein
MTSVFRFVLVSTGGWEENLKEESNQESGSEGVSPAKKKWSIGDGEP